MSKITKYLNQLITGNAFDAPEILEAYSTDQSALKVNPRLVVLPESTADLQKLMRFFDQLAGKDVRVPVAIRGSGLDEMGADLSTGVVISTEKLNRLEEIDKRERLVRVQAGITLKEQAGEVKVSLRTGDKVDASAVCAMFGGGGHKQAAGCTLYCGMEEAEKKIVEALGKVLN